MGAAWLPPLLDRLDAMLATIRDTGATGEMRFNQDHVLPRTASEYFSQNCWIGLSIPSKPDRSAIARLGTDRIMWGSDYPHDEGTYPFSRENLRAIFAGTEPAQLRRMLSENAAELFDFDLEALKPLASRVGPTMEEISRPLDQLPDAPNEALRRAMGERL
jgi:hypothetical protein